MFLSTVTWNGPGLVGSAVGQASPTQPLGTGPVGGSAAPPVSVAGTSRPATGAPSSEEGVGLPVAGAGAVSGDGLAPGVVASAAGAEGDGCDETGEPSSLEQLSRASGSAALARPQRES